MKKTEEKIQLKGIKRQFQCENCGAIITSEDYIIIPIPPSECHENQGGCGRTTKFMDVTFALNRPNEEKK